jgi:hypothetical protein
VLPAHGVKKIEPASNVGALRSKEAAAREIRPSG